MSKQEYAEKELNELIHKYEENQEARKVAFNKRVEREIEEAKKKSEAVKKENAKLKEEAEAKAAEANEGSVQKENVLDSVMEQDDAWSKNQLKEKDGDKDKDTA